MEYFINRLMPTFEADGTAGAGSGAGTSPVTDEGKDETSPVINEKKDETNNNTDNIDKLFQAKLDKAMAEERKKNASLRKEIEKMKREKMTADELKKYDDEKRINELAEREKTIAEKENRYYAITALKKAGLDDGSEIVLDLASLVMGTDTDETDERIITLNKLVTKMVDNKVNERFKSFGRTPANGGNSNNENDENSLAKNLGKQKAEQAKKSKDILKHYIGR